MKKSVPSFLLMGLFPATRLPKQRPPYVSGAPWKDLGVCSSGGSGRISAGNEEIRKLVSIYPNPANELIHVEFFLNDDNTEVQFEIVDLNARLMQVSHELFSKGNQETTLHLTSLSPQLYILRVTTKGSQIIGTQTFIYQK